MNSLTAEYSDLPNNRAANFIPIIGIKFAARLFGRSEYLYLLSISYVLSNVNRYTKKSIQISDNELRWFSAKKHI